MTNHDQSRVQSLFLAALEFPADERDAWLIEQCEGDEQLLFEVRSLLKHDNPDDDPLEKELGEVLGDLPPLSQAEPEVEDQRATFDHHVLLSRLAAAAVIPERHLRELRETVESTAETTSAEAIVESLVKSNRLTKFQAEQLLLGHESQLRLGNYLILDDLGRGGMGQVFRARHERMKREVALKILPPESTDSQEMLQRFEREIEAIAKLTHPNIATAYDADNANGVHFLVMEYVPGLNLSSLVKKEGPRPVEEAVNYVLQAARGLASAHQAGVTHRDVKPSNLILDANGVVKVLDFGLAQMQSETRDAYTKTQIQLTNTSTLLGTVDFLAPEQARNIKNADHRADIYSLGCTLYYLLTGKPVYAGNSMMEKLAAHQKQAIPSVPAPTSLNSVFQRMVAKKPQHRFQSMDEVIESLLPFIDAEETTIWTSQSTLITNLKSETVELFHTRGRQIALIALVASSIVGLVAWMIHMGGNSSGTSPNSSSQLITDKGSNSQDEAKPPVERVTFIAGETERAAITPPEIAAAQWILASGGALTIAVPGRGDLEVKTIAEMPADGFVITKCVLRGAADVDDDGLALLEGVSNSLYWLDLTETSVTDQGMVHLKNASKLQVLYLSRTSVGDLGLSQFEGLHELRNLMLDGTAVSDKTMPLISRFRGLIELDLTSTHVSDIGLKSLESLSNLINLYLWNTDVTDQGVARLLPKLTELRLLRLNGNGERITNEIMPILQQLRHLEQLSLARTAVNQDGIADIDKNPALRLLYLDGLKIGDAGIAPIIRLPNLQVLSISSTGVTDITLDRLSSKNSLEQINIHGNQISEDAVSRLQQALPNLEIIR